MLRRLLAALAVLTSPLVAAQDSPRVALVPLDSRPATSALPARVGAVAGLEVLVPPAELLGTAQRGADPTALAGWWQEADPNVLVVSLDALAYGGLVQSRSSTTSADVAWGNLQHLRLWRQVTGKPAHGFIVIPRHPDAKDRARNLAVITWALAWAEDGTLDSLTVTWDDALRGSPAPAEGQQVRDEATRRGLANVFVRPGADEVASVLVARLAAERAGIRPTLRVEHSVPLDAVRVLPYDSVPLAETLRAQAEAAGFVLADTAADLTLYAYSGGDPRQAALEINSLQRQGEAVAVVDVARVNTVDARLAGDIVTLGAFPQLLAFAGWGTPGNNVGTAVAHAMARAVGGPKPAHAQLLALEYLNDALYSSVVRAEVRREWREEALASPEAATDLLARLRERAQAVSTRLEPGSRLSVTEAGFPWSRSFEAWLEVALQPLEPALCGRLSACLVP